jgi:hypothetical protein
MSSIDYIQFHSPYIIRDRLKRYLWTVAWNVLARPFPKIL